MTKFLIILLITFLNSNVKAQDGYKISFFSKGCKWYYENNNPNTPHIKNIMVYKVKDTSMQIKSNAYFNNKATRPFHKLRFDYLDSNANIVGGHYYYTYTNDTMVDELNKLNDHLNYYTYQRVFSHQYFIDTANVCCDFFLYDFDYVDCNKGGVYIDYIVDNVDYLTQSFSSNVGVVRGDSLICVSINNVILRAKKIKSEKSLLGFSTTNFNFDGWTYDRIGNLFYFLPVDTIQDSARAWGKLIYYFDSTLGYFYPNITPIEFCKNITTDIKKNTEEFEFTIYPNPIAIGNTIQLNVNKPIENMYVYNYLGKEIPFFYENNYLNIETTNKGIYFIKLKLSNNRYYVKKIILE